TTLKLQALYHLLKIEQRVHAPLAPDQLVKDDAVDALPLLRRGPHVIQVHLLQLFRIHGATHQKLCSGQPQLFETAPLRIFADFFRNMQPGQGRSGNNEWKGLMDRVVRADQKVGAGALQRLRRAQHQLSHSFPVHAVVDWLHVFGQRDGMHGDLRMRVPSHERFGFKADRPIAERGALRAAADNADMFAHARKSICCKKRSFFSTGRNEASKELRASSRRCSSEKLNSSCAISYSRLSEVWNIAGSSVLSVIINPWSKNFRSGCS